MRTSRSQKKPSKELNKKKKKELSVSVTQNQNLFSAACEGSWEGHGAPPRSVRRGEI